MVRNYKKKFPINVKITERQYTDGLSKVAAGSSIRQAAKDCRMSEFSFRRRLKAPLEQGQHLGTPMSLPEASERDLAVVLTIKSKWGFALSRKEVQDLVEEYVQLNKRKNTELGRYLTKYCKFKNNRPGADWLKAFMNRCQLSCKLPSTLEKARKVATTNPDII